MSWDVMVFNLRGKSPPPIEQFEESDTAPLGFAADVQRRISEKLDSVDWSNPTWGLFQGDGYSIEFNVGRDDLITNIMLHIRGDGDPLPAITRFAQPLGWAVLDLSTSAFLDLGNPSPTGWEAFKAFRDKAIRKQQDDGGS